MPNNSRGYIHDVQDALRSQLPRHVAGTVVERTEHVHVDPWLVGYYRFSKRLGNGYAVLVPDNSTRLSKPAEKNSYRISVTHIPASLHPGQLIQIGSSEIVRVTAIDDLKKDLVFDSALLFDYAQFSAVDIYGDFCQVQGEAAAGTSFLVIHSPHKVFKGDVFRVDDGDDAWGEYEVADFIYVGRESLSIGYLSDPYVYQIELARPLDIPVPLGSWVVMRAFPAYESESLVLPESSSNGHAPWGPFLLDWMSGETTEISNNRVIQETAHYQLLDKTKTHITGWAPLQKNHLIYRGRMLADTLLFWNVDRGSVNYDGRDCLITLDSTGQFFMSLPLVPAWDPGQIALWNCAVKAPPFRDWIIPVLPDFDPALGDFDWSLLESILSELIPVDRPATPTEWLEAIRDARIHTSEQFRLFLLEQVRLRRIQQKMDEIRAQVEELARPLVVGFRSYPSGLEREILVRPGEHDTLLFPLRPGDPPMEAWEIYASGPPGLTLRLSDISPYGSTPGYVKWTVVAKVTGRYSWGLTGLFVKPFFKTIRSIKPKNGVPPQMDGSTIML